MNLYLVRHGVTYWNQSGRLQGWHDVALTSGGLAQAEKTAEFFAGYCAQQQQCIAALYTSPLKRARVTAERIGALLDLPPIVVPDLREMHAGAVEGLRREEWQARWPALVAAWEDRANPDFGWPGGETRRAFRARVLRVFADLIAQHAAADNLVVVTHGGVIKAFLTNAGLDDPAGPRVYNAANCSITHVEYAVDDTQEQAPQLWSVGCLVAFNQVGHLEDEDSPAELPANADLALL